MPGRIRLLTVLAAASLQASTVNAAQPPSQPQIRSISESADRVMGVGGTPQPEAAPAMAPRQSGTHSLCAWPMTCRAAPAPTGSLNLTAYRHEVDEAALRWGVDPSIVRAVIHAESAFNPKAVSPKGAQGLMQLMPATATRFDVEDAFDAAQNIDGGVQYLAWLADRYDNELTLVAAAYNAGEGAVDRYGGVPPYRETRNYVAKVTGLADRYRAESGTLASLGSTLATTSR